MNRKILLLLCLILLLSLAVYLGRDQSVNFIKYKTGFAPDFSLKDIDGKTVTLNSFKGHSLLIFFGTTWCPQCRIEMTALKKHYDQYAPRGLKIIYIDINESAERVSRFTQQNLYPGMVLLDLDGSVAYDYNVIGVPTVILVNAEGTIIRKGRQVSDLSLDTLFPEKK